VALLVISIRDMSTRDQTLMKRIRILLIFALSLVPIAASAELPFIQDQYTQALAEAKQKKQPIFVECWAPW